MLNAWQLKSVQAKVTVTKTERFGVFLVAAGSLAVISVVLVWLLAPLTIVPPDSATVDAESSLPFNEQDALAPYDPAAPAIPTKIPVAEPIANESQKTDQEKEVANNEPDSPERDSAVNTKASASAADNNARSKHFLRLAIPSLSIDAPVEPVNLTELYDASGKTFTQWAVPDKYAAGWHNSSAPPGQPGNTVINGHNNIHGAIFKDLVDLTIGEKIIIYEDGQEHIYQVVHREFLRERGESLRTRLRNASWILPSKDERLTIVTCWPNTTNSHRLVLIAKPLSSEPGF